MGKSKPKKGEIGYISSSEKKQIKGVGKTAIVVVLTAIGTVSILFLVLFGGDFPIVIAPDGDPVNTGLSVGGLTIAVVVIIMAMVVLTVMIKAMDRDGKAKWGK